VVTWQRKEPTEINLFKQNAKFKKKGLLNMAYIPIPKKHTPKLTKREAIEELNRLISSKKDDITIITRTAEIVNSTIDLGEDLRFDYIATLFDGSIGAAKLRAANVKKAAKGMRQAITDLGRDNPYHVQYQYIAHYRDPVMPDIDKKIRSDKINHVILGLKKIAPQGDKWFKGLPNEKSFKVDGKDNTFYRFAVSVKADLVDSHNKVIEEFGESTPKQQLAQSRTQR
jgi:hypothetical protein